MRYLIDGYNLLHVLGLCGGRFGPRALEKSRNDLIAWLAAERRTERDRITVVFDGAQAPPHLDSRREQDGVAILFSTGALADDLLEQCIRDDPQPQTLTVISSDHRIQAAARRRGCVALDSQEFIDQSMKRARSVSPHRPPEKPQDESAQDANRWIDTFADVDRQSDVQDFNRPFKEFGLDGAEQ